MSDDEPTFAQQWVSKKEEQYRQEVEHLEKQILTHLICGEEQHGRGYECEFNDTSSPAYEAATRLESQGLVVRREESGRTYWRLAIPGFDKPVA